MERWTVYCDKLYKDHGGSNNMVRDLERMTPTSTEEPHDILYSEVEVEIFLLKNNKSPGPGGITAEMLKAEGKRPIREIHKLCSKAW